MQRTHTQRGSTLLMAVSLLAVLFFGAATVLTQVADDSQGGGAMLAGQQVLYIAEAGVVAGSDALRHLLFPLGTEQSPTIANLVAQGTLAAGDAICADGLDCTLWHPLQVGTVPYGKGQYRLAASCMPSPCASGNTITAVRVRSLATIGTTSSRLLEDQFAVTTP